MNPGEQIAEHWPLITGLMGAAFSGIGAYVAIKKMVRSEINDTVLLSLQNGLGERVREIVRLGVGDALRSHEISCPLRERFEEHTDNLTRLHERVDDIYGPSKVRR